MIIAQTKQLSYQKVRGKIRADRDKELVTKNQQQEEYERFDSDYRQLMGDNEDEKLPLKYVGKKTMVVEPSLNNLTRIQEKY